MKKLKIKQAKKRRKHKNPNLLAIKIGRKVEIFQFPSQKAVKETMEELKECFPGIEMMRTI
jgi:hypothetical protein